MERPWFKFHTRDWLDNKELRRCSPVARALLADLMCLAHEGEPYGHLSDKVGPLTIGYISQRSCMKTAAFTKAIGELVLHGRLAKDERSGSFYVPRMVEDEALRTKLSEAGKRGGNPDLVKDTLNPPDKGRLNQPSDSDSVSGSVVSFPKKARTENSLSFEEIADAWKWYQAEYPREVFPHAESQLFVSVMETPQDLADLRQNLPLYKSSWNPGYEPSSENFLSKRMFSVAPKARDSPPYRSKQQEQADAWDRA